MKKVLQVLAGILISAFFLWLAFRNSDIGAITEILKTTDLLLYAGAFFAGVIALLVRSQRWKLLGKEYGETPWRFFFKATTIGLMLNAFLPFRTGDLFQGYFLSKHSGKPKSYTLATVFMERLIDFIPPSIMIVVGSFFIVLPSQIKIERLIMLVGGAFAVIFVFIRFHSVFLSFIERFIKQSHSDKLKGFLKNIVNALVFFKDKQVLTKALPLTFLVWLLYTAATFMMLRAVGIELNFWATFVIQAVTVLSVAIPSSPGFVGTWEFFCLLALGIFDIGTDRALSFAIVSHLMAFLPTTVFGAFFLYKEVFLKGNRVSSMIKESPDTSARSKTT